MVHIFLIKPTKKVLNDELLSHLNLLEDKLLLLGDLNSHHTNWFVKKSDSNRKILNDFIHTNQLVLHNNSQLTYTSLHHCERHSIISDNQSSNFVNNFSVDKEEDFGSDHSPELLK